MAEHIVSSYDADLQSLRRRIPRWAAVAEKMLSDATDAWCAARCRWPGP
jgi:phosphate transport system protein